MAFLKFLKFQNHIEASHMLAGAVTVPNCYVGNERIFSLHGLTLTFSTPAVTVTFSDASNAGLTMQDVTAQIKSAGGGAALKAVIYNGRLYVVQQTPSASVVLNLTTSTAKALFGWSSGATGNHSGRYYNPPGGVAPRVLAFQPGPQGDSLVVLTEEA
jgi:hypothetical protein